MLLVVLLVRPSCNAFDAFDTTWAEVKFCKYTKNAIFTSAFEPTYLKSLSHVLPRINQNKYKHGLCPFLFPNNITFIRL